nr:hypothetical protein [uncultured Porphyromonas sp.]
MNIRTTLLALVTVLGASSCGEWYVDSDEAHLLGYPRVCDQIVSRPMCSVVQTHTFGENTSTSRHLYVVENEAVQAEDFVLWVMTGEHLGCGNGCRETPARRLGGIGMSLWGVESVGSLLAIAD